MIYNIALCSVLCAVCIVVRSERSPLAMHRPSSAGWVALEEWPSWRRTNCLTTDWHTHWWKENDSCCDWMTSKCMLYRYIAISVNPIMMRGRCDCQDAKCVNSKDTGISILTIYLWLIWCCTPSYSTYRFVCIELIFVQYTMKNWQSNSNKFQYIWTFHIVRCTYRTRQIKPRTCLLVSYSVTAKDSTYSIKNLASLPATLPTVHCIL